MSDPLEDDPEVLLELNFISKPLAGPRAAAAVATALSEIDMGCASNATAHAKRLRRATRVKDHLGDFSIIELAVAEYITREADADGSVKFGEAQSGAADAVWQAEKLMTRLEAMSNALSFAETTGEGREVKDSLNAAASEAIDAWLALRRATEALNTAARFLPASARGPGGALAKLRLSPDVALLAKLEAIWEASGLKVSSGDTGDGLDVFLRHAIEAVHPRRTSKRNWLDKIRERAKNGSVK